MQALVACKAALVQQCVARGTLALSFSLGGVQQSRHTVPCQIRPSSARVPRRRWSGSRSMRASAQQQEQATAANVPALRERLMQLIDATYKERPGDKSFRRSATLPDEATTILEQLEVIGEKEAKKLTPDVVEGIFDGVMNNSTNLDNENCTTIGTLTFQQLGPKDMRVRMFENEVRQGVDFPGQYHTLAFFKVVGGEYDGMEGIQTAMAEYDLEAEKNIRQNVYFCGIKIEPKNKDPESVARWLAAMKDANPMMDENGVAELRFPQKIRGFRDFFYTDETLQVTRGNRGSIVIVKRKNSSLV